MISFLFIFNLLFCLKYQESYWNQFGIDKMENDDITDDYVKQEKNV